MWDWVHGAGPSAAWERGLTGQMDLTDLTDLTDQEGLTDLTGPSDPTDPTDPTHQKDMAISNAKLEMCICG